MEERISNTETEFQLMEGDSTVVLDKVKLHEVVASGSLNFDDWTSLISEIEKAYPDDIETICLVYDSFLSEFPLCYGYWRKYVNHKIRLCTIDKIVEVFEQAVLSATYSVDVWVDYCNFGRAVFEDPSDVRRLFKRALSFVGKDYLCHTLWDKYIEFEFSLKHWSSLAHIYIQTLRFPTKKLHRYYDSFKKLVEIWEKEMESCSNSDTTVSVEPMLDSEASICSSQDDISCIIKDLLHPSTGLDRLKELQKYVFFGEHFFHEASRLNEKINCYETRIKRSYFHVKPLDANQLENWHHYLDFVESHGDFDWAVKLYERCLIPCANYPDFWMRYMEFMESKGGREIANLALDRATQIFLKKESVIHLFNARFKEHTGDVLNARAAFLQCNTESDSDFVENVVMRANMEKRLGNFTSASNIYKEALEMATSKEKWHILPILYVHFSRLKYMTHDCEDAARDILIDGIKHVPCSKFLMEELIKFVTMHGGSRHINMVDAIVANAISPGPGVSQSLSAKDGEEISKLYLEFVDLCGSLHDVRKAWNRHIRLFPQSVRATLFRPDMGTKQWKMVMEAQEETPVGLPHQPSGDFSSNCLMQSSLQDEKLSSPKNDDTQAAHPATDQVLDQKSPLVEEHNILSNRESFQESPLSENPKELSENDQKSVDQEKDNLLQSGESDNNVHESVYQGSPNVPELSGEDFLEPNPSLDLKHQVVNNTESPASLEFSKEDDVQKQDDHEREQDLKPPSLERLSLDSQDAKSPGPVSPVSYDSGAPKETSLSDESVPKSEAPQKNGMPNENMSESGQDAYVDPITSSPMSTQATVSTQTNIGHVSPSSSASNQNVLVKALLQPQKPANNGKNWHQRSNSDRFRRDSKFGFHGHSHKRLQKQQQSSQQTHTRAEKGSQMHMNQDYPSQPRSSQNPLVHQGPQVQSECPASTVHTNQTVPQAWPMYNMQQQNLSPACQSQPPVQPVIYPQHPMQSIEQPGNAQNNQAYNQMWQYYYYQQQQQLLWQQQQLLQHQQPQQQQLLQQQLLQMQYLQQQQQVQQLQPQQQQQLLLQQGQLQQQQPYQLQQQLLEQQSYQQQHLLYLQQLQQQQSLLQQQSSPTTNTPATTTSK